ncbi:MAG: beta-hydroxyacyl-ACP dehydratase [Bacteroidales bacterium]|nr:beta-hydroxyacyl-ACP dehydratase [Bacteroidales bacterium]
MDKEAIQELLPHREPMLLIDKAWMDDDGTAHATFLIPEDPFFCRGHFPGNPIVPGVILCEIMAQSCITLLEDVLKTNILMYRGLDGVKFRGVVRPGDLCEINATLVEQKGSISICDAVLSVAGKRCAQARITLAATPKAYS